MNRELLDSKMNDEEYHLRGMTGDDPYLTLPPCHYCKHVMQNGGIYLDRYTCKAFPDGVPARITFRREVCQCRYVET
jgi:hypothetical protein